MSEPEPAPDDWIDECIHLTWSGCSSAWDRDDPTQYLQETEGEIRWFDEDTNEELVGKFRLFYVDIVGAVRGGIALFDVLDGDSTTIDYFAPLFGRDAPWFRDRVLRLVGRPTIPIANLLILDRLEVLPRFRGRLLGQAAMKEMIARFGMGTAVVAIKPFPLQFEATLRPATEPWRHSMALDQFSQDFDKTTAKLVSHYAKIGFRRLSRTPFMMRLTYE